MAFPPNHRHGHARADGGSNVTASDRRRIADRVAAQEIALFCLKRFLIIVVAIFGGLRLDLVLEPVTFRSYRAAVACESGQSSRAATTCNNLLLRTKIEQTNINTDGLRQRGNARNRR